MEVTTITGDGADIRIDKQLNISNSNHLKQLLLELIEQGIRNVSLDFACTEVIDSSGLGKILFFSENLQQKSGSLKIVNVQNQELQDLFKLIQLDSIVHIEYI